MRHFPTLDNGKVDAYIEFSVGGGQGEEIGIDAVRVYPKGNV